jgi:beta-galactosidase
VRFKAPVKGRYFCIESLNAHGGKPYASIAELDLLGTDGKLIPHGSWTVAYVDSEERAKEDGTAENAIDGQTANYWHTQWSGSSPAHPHRVILDLGKKETVEGMLYVPREGGDNTPGRIKDYTIYMGDHLIKDAQ